VSNAHGCVKSFAIGLIFLLIPSIGLAQAVSSSNKAKKRDPFVALVKSDGKIKSAEELFPIAEEKPLSVHITVNAIIWDEKRPVALVNGKVYPEGAKIAPGVIVEKIDPRSIVVNDNGSLVTIKLQKLGN